jgi:hypothetical protein
MICFLDRCLRLDFELPAKIVQYRYFNKLQALKTKADRLLMFF